MKVTARRLCKKLFAAIPSGCLLFSSQAAFSTAFVVAITPWGLVVDADSLRGFPNTDRTESVCKIRENHGVLLIVWGNAGWTSAASPDLRGISQAFIDAKEGSAKDRDEIDPFGKILCFPSSLGGHFRLPFYIGKGTIDRAYCLKRNQGHGFRLKELFDQGAERSEIVKVIGQNLPEAKAFELEAKVIYYFGTIYEPNRNGILLNLDTGLRPDFTLVMQKREKQQSNSKP